MKIKSVITLLMSNPSYNVTALGGGSVTVPINQVFDLNITIASGGNSVGFGYFIMGIYIVTFYQLNNSENSNNYSVASTTPEQYIQMTTISNISYSTLGSNTVTIYQYQGNNPTQIPLYNQCTRGGSLGSFTINVVNPSLPCFKEGSRILTNMGYKFIEELRKGDLVKTLKNDFLPIELIGKSVIYNSGDEDRMKDRLYLCSKDNYPELLEDLIITGCHSILVDWITQEQREKTIKEVGDIFVTDNKYRLIACIDEKAQPYPLEGSFPIYHLALQNEHYIGNYGIYANGLLVESCSLRYLKELSNMQLIE